MITELFGGAMAAAIPQGFDDCSAFRVVPDNQEVFTHAPSGTSLIVELMARQSSVDNTVCGSYFFNDLADSNKSQFTQILPIGLNMPQEDLNLEKDAPRIACGGKCAFGTIVHGHQAISKFTNENGKENLVYVCMAILRFPPLVSTEILISVSSPQTVHEGSSEERVVEEIVSQETSLQLLRDVVRSLTINDYGLFVPEE